MREARICLFVFLFLVNIGVAADSKCNLSVSAARELIPRALLLKRVPGLSAGAVGCEVFARDRAFLGWVFVSDTVAPVVRGYREEIGVLVALSPQGQIMRIKLLRHMETRKSMLMIKKPFYEGFRGKNPKTPGDIDIVTGATMSSRAIVRDVMLSSRVFLELPDVKKRMARR